MIYIIEAVDKNVKLAKTNSVAVTVTNDNEAPTVKHEHIACAAVGKPLTVTATVTDPAGVRWVRLRYRSVTQFEDYKTLDMTATGNKGRYSATVPGDQIIAKYDFMYLIEVMDNDGNGTIYPDLDKETPYMVVKLGEQQEQ